MLKYKLTTQGNFTANNTFWDVNVAKETNGIKSTLCNDSWLHYYHTPELAILLNFGHSNFENPKLWECEAEGKHLDDHGLKGGCTKLTLIREIPKPEFTSRQRTAICYELANYTYLSVNEKHMHISSKFSLALSNYLDLIKRSLSDERIDIESLVSQWKDTSYEFKHNVETDLISLAGWVAYYYKKYKIKDDSNKQAFMFEHYIFATICNFAVIHKGDYNLITSLIHKAKEI